MKKSDAKRFETLLIKGSGREEDYDELINIVRESGNMEKTKEKAQRYVNEAAK